jgi:Amt family ammonium transporter
VTFDDVTGWGIAAAAFVMLVPVGLAMLVAGFSRAQNVIHTLTGIVMLYSVALIAYWVVGFRIQLHGALFLRGAARSPGELLRFPFLAILAAITAIIPAGTLAERWRFASVITLGSIVAAVIYPLVARWVWNDGWLARLGASSGLGHGVVDFAGGAVIHLVGGVVALAGAMVVGSRTHKFARDGRPNAMPGHHVPMFVVGSLLLGIGWLGFVIGLGGGLAKSSLALAGANIIVAPAASVLAATAYMSWRFGPPDPSLVANALLGGLVSISAGSAFVSGWAAVFIGIAAGPLVIESVLGLERLHVDDPVGAVSTHGVCGAWGMLAAGLLANGRNGYGLNGVQGPVRGLLYGDAAQFLAQAAGTVVVIVFVLGASYVLFRVLGWSMGNRVPVEAELEGLDTAELGATAYPDFDVDSSPRDSRQ